MNMRERVATALLNTIGLTGIKHPQVIDNAVDSVLAAMRELQPSEEITIMLSTRDLSALCNAAVLKGQSLQDFVFLAASNAANAVLIIERPRHDSCSGVKVYNKEMNDE